MIEGRDSREAWLSQRYRVNDEVIIESLQRWHILSPKVGRLSSRKTAWQYSVPLIPWSSTLSHIFLQDTCEAICETYWAVLEDESSEAAARACGKGCVCRYVSSPLTLAPPVDYVITYSSVLGM